MSPICAEGSAITFGLSRLLRRPMKAQFSVEVCPALLGKENPGAPELHTPPCSRDRPSEPVRPLDVEVHVIGTPDDQCRRLQFLQARFNRTCVLVVEGGEEPLEVSCALLVPDQRPQVGFYDVIANLVRVLIGRTKRFRRAIDVLVREHRIQRFAQTTIRRHR